MSERLYQRSNFRSNRRDPRTRAEAVVTIVCVGMSEAASKAVTMSAGVPAERIVIDSIRGFDVERASTGFLVFVDRELGIGWLKRIMHRQASAESFCEDSVSCETVYRLKERAKQKDALSVAIIVTVYNRPDVAVPCIESIIERTRYPFKELIIMDDASDDYTLHRLKSLDDPRIRVFSSNKNNGYLHQANSALREAYKTCTHAVLVNSDVLVTPGWLTGMMDCVHETGADLVNPMCNSAAAQSIPFPMQASHGGPEVQGGKSYLNVGLSLLFQEPVYPDAVPSIGQCLLVSKGAWDRHGPFDASLWGTGYGEECDLWGKVVSSGGVAKIADNSYVYHESHATHGLNAGDSEKNGFNRFLEIHGDLYRRKLRRSSDFKSHVSPHLSKIASSGAIGLPVGFVATDVGPWGGVMCILRIVEGLEELGFNCSMGFITKSRASSDETPLRMKFGPLRFRGSRDFRNWGDMAGWRRGLVFATHFHSSMYLDRVRLSTDVTPAAFWQDREDFFRGPLGNLTVGEDFTENYASIPNRIVNARWVGDSAVEDLGIKSFSHIPVGVDIDLFYPSTERCMEGKIRVISMWRPLTPRRGHERLVRIYKAVRERLGSDVSLEVYGQNESLHLLEGLVDVHHGWLDQRELADILRSVDVVVEPSDFQGFGLPGLEAMASGCLLVSTDNKGIHEYGVHGSNCFISNDEGFLVDSIISSFESPKDAEEMTAQARRDAINYDWRMICARWAEVILSWDVNWPQGYESERDMILERVESVKKKFRGRV